MVKTSTKGNGLDYSRISEKRKKLKDAESKRFRFRTFPIIFFTLAVSLALTYIVATYSPATTSQIIITFFYAIFLTFGAFNAIWDFVERRFPDTTIFLEYSTTVYQPTYIEEKLFFIGEAINCLDNKEFPKLKLALIKLSKSFWQSAKNMTSSFCDDRQHTALKVKNNLDTFAKFISINRSDSESMDLIKGYLDSVGQQLLEGKTLESWTLPEIRNIREIVSKLESEKLNTTSWLDKKKQYVIVYFIIGVPILFYAPIQLANYFPYTPDNILIALVTLFGLGGLKTILPQGK